MKKLKFKVAALRTLASPYRKDSKDGSNNETIYYLLVNMKDLPENIPMDVNPRVPKMTTNVAKALIKAVTDPETDFYINNRGIVISAKALSFNSSDSEVTIDIGNQEIDEERENYGILDGGHTYTAIINNRKDIPEGTEKYVRLEVITNVENITRLSDARNTSIQVSDLALFNLDGGLDNIKEAIKSEPYADDVAYKDHENKTIHVSEFVRLMFAFDIERFPDDRTAPIQSYSGKAQATKRYAEAFNGAFYKALTKELPMLVKLYDKIEEQLVEKYKEYKKQQGVGIPRPGAVKGIDLKENATTQFLHSKIDHVISVGYIYPIFGAFRALLSFNKDKGEISWNFKPLEIWNEIGTDLVQNVFESTNNPQLAGKDKQLWLSNYRIVETQSLRKLLGKR